MFGANRNNKQETMATWLVSNGAEIGQAENNRPKNTYTLETSLHTSKHGESKELQGSGRHPRKEHTVGRPDKPTRKNRRACPDLPARGCKAHKRRSRAGAMGHTVLTPPSKVWRRRRKTRRRRATWRFVCGPTALEQKEEHKAAAVATPENMVQ